MLQALKNVLKNDSFIALSANIGNAGLGFLSFIFLAKWMSKDEFGFWLLYLAAFSFIELFRAGMIHQALVQNLSTTEDRKGKKQIIGAAWCISLAFTAIICLILFSINLLFPVWRDQTGLTIFFQGYPAVIWFTLPLSMTQWVKHAEQNYIKMGAVNILSNFLFLGLLGLSVFFQEEFTAHYAFLMHTFSRLIISLFVMLYNWSGFRNIRFANKFAIKKQLNFGKYSMLTLMGTNLLRSADIFLIGYFLGSAKVAIYSLPLKLIEIAEMPLRAFATTAFPRFSKLFASDQKDKVVELFVEQVLFLSICLIIPLILGLFLAEPIILLLGGEEYLEGVWVFRVFMVFVFFLPLDRLSGVLLDGIGSPQVNTFKVTLMTLINVIGDIVALCYFESLFMVALVTILNINLGILIALFSLRGFLPFKRKTVFTFIYFSKIKELIVATRLFQGKKTG